MTPSRATGIVWAAAVVFYVLLFGVEAAYPHSPASGIVFVGAAAFALAIVWPDRNLQPSRPRAYWAVLFAAILGTAFLAAQGAKLIRLQLPYDPSLNVVPLLPGLIAITGLEEIVFRQGMFRWLVLRGVGPRSVVLTTAATFAAGHLGPLIAGTTKLVAFTLLQTLLLLWVGLLLGEIRRSTNSWLMSWVAHAAYNAAILSSLAVSLW